MMAVTALAGCNEFPRDQEGTSDRIEQTHQIRIGMTALDTGDAERARGFIARLARDRGAQPVIVGGTLENQLSLLEAGRLDLVMGEFAEDSPWLADVAVIEPLTTRDSGERKTGLAPAAANGENAWIMVLERLVRADNQEANR